MVYALYRIIVGMMWANEMADNPYLKLNTRQSSAAYCSAQTSKVPTMHCSMLYAIIAILCCSL